MCFHTHGQLVEVYFEAIVAEKGKKFIWLEQSAHTFHPDNTGEIEILLNYELKFAMET
ncbi:hypothetical protein [Oceanobacillus chungangensis]|uniref:hypothetical protein n=1 Tax=Oceanobacillus chungangensis TaxID=1229152 RepID=UPI0014759500|nr:hypothetical protein [Oceanobacillus chungangensis]